MDITKTYISKNVKAVTSIPGWFSQLTNGSNSLGSTAQAYIYVPLIYRATNLIANAISNVPVKFYAGRGEKERPWPFRNGFSSLIWKAVASSLLTGSAYWERVQNDYGRPQNAIYRNPYTINVEYSAQDNAITFKQNIEGRGATWKNYPDENKYQMVYFREFDPSNDVTNGVGAAEVSLTNAQLMRYIDRFAAKFFEGGAMPVTFLGMDVSTSQEEVGRVEKWVRSAATGINNAFNIIGIRAGAITAQQLTPNMKDLVIPELHDQARSNIALAFGIPQTMLEDAANYATAKEHRLSFYEETIMPRANQIEDTINEQLLADVGMRMEFDFGSMSIFQADEGERVATAQSYYNMTRNVALSFELAGIELTEEQALLLVEPEPETPKEETTDPEENTPQDEDLKRWQKKAIKRVQTGKAALCEFDSEHIDQMLHARITAQLETCQTVDEVKAVFDNIKQPEIFDLLTSLSKVVEALNAG